MPSRVRASSIRVTVLFSVCSVRPIPYDCFRSCRSRSLNLAATLPASANSAMSTNGPVVQRYSPVNSSRLRSRKRHVEYPRSVWLPPRSGIRKYGTSFPFDFGFVPSTRAADGDPIDVLVLMDEAVPAGVVVACRLVGVIEAEQTDREGTSRRNDRLLAVAEASHRYGRCRTIADIGDGVLEEVERFFVFYNEQQGQRFRPLGRFGLARAKRLVDDAAQAWVDRRNEASP